MTVRMELSRILIRELTDYQVIELRESGDNGTPEDELRTFPIVIGLPEAQAIERRLSGVPVKRPQTHDLLANIVDSLGGSLESVSITDLADQTFYAILAIRDVHGDVIEVDARPSDAIALGIGVGVPIYVAEHVLAQATSEHPLDDQFEDEVDDDEGDAGPPF